MTPVKGHLELFDKGYGFLRDIRKNFEPSPADTFVPAHIIGRHNLLEGHRVEGGAEKGSENSTNLKLTVVERVNGLPWKQVAGLLCLQDRVSVHPTDKFSLTLGPDDIMGKALDCIVPVGRGTRGLIVSPPKSGKTTILKHMARAIALNHPDVDLFMLLVDERPEEVTDFRRSLKRVHVLSSSSDQSTEQHMRMTRMAMNTATRCAEIGRDTVVFIDSLTRMARAFNTETRSHGRTLTGGLGANALEVPRRIFGAARNIENGGSLTILASILVDTGSRMDDIIFQEFKGTGNMDLVLSRECAEQRIWPAIHINQSGTRNEHLLLDKENYEKIVKIRRILSERDPVSAMADFIEFLDRD